MAKTTVTQSGKSTSTQQTSMQQTTKNVLDKELLSTLLSGLADTTYKQKTSDELQQMAENLLAGAHNAEMEGARQTQASRDLAYAQQLSNMERAYGKNIDTQNAAFDKSRASIENAALSRGMGRSSYAISTLSNNDIARSEALARMADDYGESVRQVAQQQALGQEQTAQTLGRLETDYQKSLAAKLQELTDTEYGRYQAGMNQQNANYLSAVQAAMGSESTGSQQSTGQTTEESVQITDTGSSGGSGSGASSAKSAAGAVNTINSKYTANLNSLLNDPKAEKKKQQVQTGSGAAGGFSSESNRVQSLM